METKQSILRDPASSHENRHCIARQSLAQEKPSSTEGKNTINDSDKGRSSDVWFHLLPHPPPAHSHRSLADASSCPLSPGPPSGSSGSHHTRTFHPPLDGDRPDHPLIRTILHPPPPHFHPRSIPSALNHIIHITNATELTSVPSRHPDPYIDIRYDLSAFSAQAKAQARVPGAIEGRQVGERYAG